MLELTPDNCDAFDIIEELGEGLDFMCDSPNIRWRAFFTQRAYNIIREDPEYIYWRDGLEFVKVFDNQTIPFIIHMMVAGIDNSIPERIPYSLGCRREVDED